jgi:hypothetical protein
MTDAFAPRITCDTLTILISLAWECPVAQLAVMYAVITRLID